MTATLQAANDALRQAVETRLAGTPADDPKLTGYSPLAGCQPAQECAAKVLTDAWQGESCCEGRKFYGHSGSETYAEWEPGFTATRAEQTLHNAVAAVRDRHTKYGPPTEHFARTAALVNAAFGTTFTAADWALVMVLDKIARQRGPGATDDAAIDIAGYAACHQECRQSQ